jgi:alpha-N-arabinofuranosidase
VATDHDREVRVRDDAIESVVSDAVTGDPELDERAGALSARQGIPYREDGARALITDTVYGPEFAVTIRLDPERPGGRPVPRGLAGVNLEAQFNGFNLVTENGELREPVVDRLRQLHLEGRSLRWPGGGYDQLDYGQCVGDVASRPLQVVFGQAQRCTFGPLEAATLADRLGAELWMQVQPMLVPAAPTADEHVRHGAVPVRTHNSSAPRDGGVVNWEIGNEQYHYPANEYSVDTYIRAARQLIEAMRAEDPSIHLWAPAHVNYANNLFSQQPDWTREVLRALGPDLHGLALHNGYAPIVPHANSAEDVAAAYRAMFSNALWASENLAQVEALIQSTVPEEHRDRLRLAITEANACFGILPFEHNLMNHAQTLASAAYMAGMLAVYARHPRVDHVHLFTGVQFTSQGLIGVTDGSFTAAPDTFSAVGLLLHLWNQWAVGRIVDSVEVASPVFASPDAGWMRRRDDIPYVDALVRREGGELGIMLVNRSLTASARVALEIPGPPPARVVVQGLLGRAPDSNPGLTIPSVVSPVPGAVLERFDQGGPGEVWIRSEQEPAPAQWPALRVPRASIVFVLADLAHVPRDTEN